MSKAVKVFEVPGQSIDGTNFQAVPSGTGTVVTTTATQTMTNKTLTAPTATDPVVTGGTFAGGTFTEPVIYVDIQALTAVGTNQATAGAITATAPGFVYSTGGNNAVGIVLPAAAATGSMYHIKNAAADILFVYPGVNCTINAIAANTKLDMATVTSATFVRMNTTAWQTIPTVPS